MSSGEGELSPVSAATCSIRNDATTLLPALAARWRRRRRGEWALPPTQNANNEGGFVINHLRC